MNLKTISGYRKTAEAQQFTQLIQQRADGAASFTQEMTANKPSPAKFKM